MLYTEVFSVANASVWHVPVGILILSAIFVGVGFGSLQSCRTESDPSLLKVFRETVFETRTVVLLPIGVLLLLLGCAVWIYLRVDIARLNSELNSPGIGVVEGKVSVEYEQPESGHSQGDIGRIGNYSFEINYFAWTNTYHLTIAHAGALTQGSLVRVYFDGPATGDPSLRRILKIERVSESTK